jgi:hypothetical protein
MECIPAVERINQGTTRICAQQTFANRVGAVSDRFNRGWPGTAGDTLRSLPDSVSAVAVCSSLRCGRTPESTDRCRLQISTQETVVSSIADVPVRGIRHALHRETADGSKAPATVVARQLVARQRAVEAGGIQRPTRFAVASSGCRFPWPLSPRVQGADQLNGAKR